VHIAEMARFLSKLWYYNFAMEGNYYLNKTVLKYMKYNKGFIGIGMTIAIIVVLAVGGVVYYTTTISTPSLSNTEDINYPSVEQNSTQSTTNNVSQLTNNPSTSSENTVTTSQDKNGKYIGYIKIVSSTDNNYYLEIDYIQWISKCVANAQTNYCMNGFEIVNSNPLIRTFPISNNAVIKMQTFSHQTSGIDVGNFNWNEVVNLSQFKGIINGSITPPSYLDMGPGANPYTGWYNTGSTTQRGIPFWITLNNGEITEITEQYLP